MNPTYLDLAKSKMAAAEQLVAQANEAKESNEVLALLRQAVTIYALIISSADGELSDFIEADTEAQNIYTACKAKLAATKNIIKKNNKLLEALIRLGTKHHAQGEYQQAIDVLAEAHFYLLEIASEISHESKEATNISELQKVVKHYLMLATKGMQEQKIQQLVTDTPMESEYKAAHVLVKMAQEQMTAAIAATPKIVFKWLNSAYNHYDHVSKQEKPATMSDADYESVKRKCNEEKENIAHILAADFELINETVKFAEERLAKNEWISPTFFQDLIGNYQALAKKATTAADKEKIKARIAYVTALQQKVAADESQLPEAKTTPGKGDAKATQGSKVSTLIINSDELMEMQANLVEDGLTKAKESLKRRDFKEAYNYLLAAHDMCLMALKLPKSPGITDQYYQNLKIKIEKVKNEVAMLKASSLEILAAATQVATELLNQGKNFNIETFEMIIVDHETFRDKQTTTPEQRNEIAQRIAAINNQLKTPRALVQKFCDTTSAKMEAAKKSFASTTFNLAIKDKKAGVKSLMTIIKELKEIIRDFTGQKYINSQASELRKQTVNRIINFQDEIIKNKSYIDKLLLLANESLEQKNYKDAEFYVENAIAFYPKAMLNASDTLKKSIADKIKEAKALLAKIAIAQNKPIAAELKQAAADNGPSKTQARRKQAMAAKIAQTSAQPHRSADTAASAASAIVTAAEEIKLTSINQLAKDLIQEHLALGDLRFDDESYENAFNEYESASTAATMLTEEDLADLHDKINQSKNKAELHLLKTDADIDFQKGNYPRALIKYESILAQVKLQPFSGSEKFEKLINKQIKRVQGKINNPAASKSLVTNNDISASTSEPSAASKATENTLETPTSNSAPSVTENSKNSVLATSPAPAKKTQTPVLETKETPDPVVAEIKKHLSAGDLFFDAKGYKAAIAEYDTAIKKFNALKNPVKTISLQTRVELHKYRAELYQLKFDADQTFKVPETVAAALAQYQDILKKLAAKPFDGTDQFKGDVEKLVVRAKKKLDTSAKTNKATSPLPVAAAPKTATAAETKATSNLQTYVELLAACEQLAKQAAITPENLHDVYTKEVWKFFNGNPTYTDPAFAAALDDLEKTEHYAKTMGILTAMIAPKHQLPKAILSSITEASGIGIFLVSKCAAMKDHSWFSAHFEPHYQNLTKKIAELRPLNPGMSRHSSFAPKAGAAGLSSRASAGAGAGSQQQQPQRVYRP